MEHFPGLATLPGIFIIFKVLLYLVFIARTHRTFDLIYQRAGAVFPQRPESTVPIYTPPQTQPLRNYPPPALRNTDYRQDVPESSSAPEVPALRYICFSLPHILISMELMLELLQYMCIICGITVMTKLSVLMPSFSLYIVQPTKRILRSLGLHLQNICSFSSH